MASWLPNAEQNMAWGLLRLSGVQRVALKGPQAMGKTEAGLRWIWDEFNNGVGPVLIVKPTRSMAHLFFENQVAPLLTSKEMRKRQSDHLYCVENSHSMLVVTYAEQFRISRSMAYRRAFLDDVDMWSNQLTEEGQTLQEVVELSVRMFEDHKILVAWTGEALIIQQNTHLQSMNRANNCTSQWNRRSVDYVNNHNKINILGSSITSGRG